MSGAPVGPYLPTNELVAAAWLGQRVPGLAADMVATTLPSNPAAWQASGFVQVVALPGGSPDLYVPIRKPVLQVDAWATPAATSGKVPWGLANHLAELVRVAVDGQAYGLPVTLPVGYLGARVLGVILATEPRRVEGDPSGYARYTLDLAVHWTRV